MDKAEPILLPFLKWAGGKRWLTLGYKYLFPSTFGTYVEPFLGGAAVFFYLSPKIAVLSDANGELIHAYQAIKSDWQKVYTSLSRHQQLHSESYYYEERNRVRRVPHEKAAQLLYLNRTCWNGLYRVNRFGKFNVPIGTKTAVLLPNDDFSEASQRLHNAELVTSDFEPIIDRAENGDFLFVDPPYVTKHNFNGFIKYNENIFTWDDQVRLSKAVARAAKRGALMLLTNADHPCIRELYQGLRCDPKIYSLERSSVLAASANQRGLVTEIAVAINYEPLRE